MFVTLAALALALPTAEEVAAALPDQGGGSCVMFTNGVCICSEWVEYIEGLKCAETANPDEAICSYNVAGHDPTGMDGNNAAQRMDVFTRTSDAKWTFAREYRPAKTIAWFERR